MGFTIKKGTLHSNGLINAHIKFENYSSLELMSIRGEPQDQMAKTYESLLKVGEGGVYLALTGLKQDSIEEVLATLDMAFLESRNSLWTYISFPDDSELAHIFFIFYHFDQSHSEKFTTHKNGFNSIQNITIEGNQNLIVLLNNLGLDSSEESANEPVTTSRFITKTGNITVIPVKDSKSRARIKQITFATKNTSKTLTLNLE